jgi:predicted AlkP superfamily pyrophosphatase or phosphodiesterase
VNGVWKKLVVAAAAYCLFEAGPAAAAPDAVRHRPVLFITIDGLRPDDVLNAGRHHLSIPVLRSFLARGAYAEEVVNVSPSLTYPNHTTLVTGVTPAEHGIGNNPVFDPFGKEHGDWYSYYTEIKAPTLWHAAHEAGLVTASLCWPVTTHAPDIDYNIPEFGRNGTERNHYLMEAVSQPSGYLEQIEKSIGPYYLEADVARNDARIEKAARIIIASKHPDFLTIHLGALDHEEHAHGPDSPQALAALETLDTMVGRLIAAEREVHPDADIVIASDHGFYRWTYAVNLNIALAKAGLITVRNPAGKSVKSWKAFAWNGGMGMIVLHDPDDAHVKAQVRQVLQTLARDPNNGIDHIYEGDEIAALGIAPNAAFVVGFRQGYAMGGKLTGPLVTPAPEPGNHGALTSRTIRRDVHSALFIMGPDIVAGKNLGVIDMRRIAPTIAGELGVAFPSAELPPLPVRDR